MLKTAEQVFSVTFVCLIEHDNLKSNRFINWVLADRHFPDMYGTINLEYMYVQLVKKRLSAWSHTTLQKAEKTTEEVGIYFCQLEGSKAVDASVG